MQHQPKIGAHERFLIAPPADFPRIRYATLDEARAVIGSEGVDHGPFGRHSAEEMAQAMFRAFGPRRTPAQIRAELEAQTETLDPYARHERIGDAIGGMFR